MRSTSSPSPLTSFSRRQYHPRTTSMWLELSLLPLFTSTNLESDEPTHNSSSSVSSQHSLSHSRLVSVPCPSIDCLMTVLGCWSYSFPVHHYILHRYPHILAITLSPHRTYLPMHIHPLPTPFRIATHHTQHHYHGLNRGVLLPIIIQLSTIGIPANYLNIRTMTTTTGMRIALTRALSTNHIPKPCRVRQHHTLQHLFTPLPLHGPRYCLP
jgi:hypothetical protein